jgi:hypothetical protein
MEQTQPARAGLRLKLPEGSLFAVQALQHGLVDTAVALRRRIAFGHKLDLRPDDVYIATYPKSGTTLMQMIVHQLRGDGGMEIPHINAVVPWLEPEIMAGNFEFLAALPSPRVFKTHALHHLLPRGAKAIYIVRDVRDVFVSGYHHQSMMHGQRLPARAFAQQFRHGKLYHGNWFRHLESWWPHRHDPNVLFFTYEGMLADLAGTVRRVAAFCGLPLDESQMPRILERCSVDFMRRHNDKFDPRLHQLEEDLATFVRRGKAGLWQEDLPAEDREELEGRVRKLAGKLGCNGEDPFAYLLRGKGEG